MKNDLSGEVDEVKKPWKSSKYYENAEKLMHAFWGKDTPFLKWFDQLDLSIAVELACGHGRHSEKVAPLAERLILIDVFEDNLSACRERLSQHQNVEYIYGNGYEFTAVADNSVSAIYCYDAMVHFSAQIVESYLKDAARILRPGGRFLSHLSNYNGPPSAHYGLNPSARNHLAKDSLDEFVARSGLREIGAETIRWGGVPDLDRICLWEKSK